MYFYLLLRLSIAGFRLVQDAVGEVRRRLAGSYREGYAHVPEGLQPGGVVGPERFIVARDPISLPAAGGSVRVARVDEVAGVRSSFRRRGRWWEATSGLVVELVPSWVVFGPSGRMVLEVISATMHVPEERAKAAVSTLDPRYITALIEGDDWRSTIAIQIRSAVSHSVRGRLARSVYEQLAAEDQPDPDWTQAMEQAYREQESDWSSVIAVATAAGLAAAFAGEIDVAAMERLSADWQRLIDWQGSPGIERRTVRARALGVAASALNFIERHPPISAVLTVAAIIAAMYVAPIPALVAFGLALLVVAAVVLMRRLRRGQRIRRRRWEPGADGDDAVAHPVQVRHAMRLLSGPPLALTTRHLVWLLRSANVWVALRGPTPLDPARTLAWLEGNAQALSIDVRPFGGGGSVLAYTDPERHREAKLEEAVAWTISMPFGRLVGLAMDLGASEIAIDAGIEPSISINTEAFGLLLDGTVSQQEAAEPTGSPPGAARSSK